MHPLDSWLAMLEGRGAVKDACVLEVAESAQLVELARDPRVGRFLLGRISDTVALVDPGREEELLKALRACGHTPKTISGLAPASVRDRGMRS